jgi:NTE family protein
LFLTSVWHYSILDTGLAITPGALFGMLFGIPAGLTSERHAGAVAVVGAFVAAIGMVVLVASTGDHRDYLGGWLPGALIYSAGAVTAFTALVGAAVTSAPPAQFGLATGVNSAIRQIGGAVGVAFVIGIVGTPSAANALHRTHTAFEVAMIAMLLASAASLLTRVPQQSPVELSIAGVNEK